MDKQDIINYVLETPTNTNPAVLSGMLDSLGGGIEIVTLFDDDITGFTYTPGGQSGPSVGRLGGTIIPVSTVGPGFLKISYEGVSAFVVMNSGDYFTSLSYINSDLPLATCNITSYYDPVDSSIITMNGKPNQDAEFEVFCQEPHHLKVEWFTI